jgi:hypothetical protein
MISSSRVGRETAGREAAPWAGVLVAAKVAAAFLGFSALVTEIATLVARNRFNAGNFFSYFTVQSNTLAVISLTVSAIATASGATRRGLDLFRGAVTLYMTTTILIFIVLLSGYPSSDLTAVPWDNTVLHYLMPIVIIIDWLIAPPQAAVAYRTALVGLAYPLSYLGYSLIRGHFVHWYPYPFMNPSHHGYAGVITTSVVIAVILAAITWGIAAVPRLSISLLRRH